MTMDFSQFDPKLPEGYDAMPDGDKVLALWREWLRWSGDPYEHGELDEYCFFCGNYKREGHAPGCMYAAICKLLGVEPK